MPMDERKIGVPEGKSPEQIQAERDLASFISTVELTVFDTEEENKGSNQWVKKQVMAKQPGKWGLLVSPEPGSSIYKLWYIDSHRVPLLNTKEGKLKFVSLDITLEKLRNFTKFLNKALENSSKDQITEKEILVRKKLAELIFEASRIRVTHIDDEVKFKEDNTALPIDTLHEKEK